MPLATLGDALASFLQRPDSCTNSMSLADYENIDRIWQNKSPQHWEPKGKRWYAATSAKTWLSTIAAYV
jgi:hypothetical protein